jgi:hypothetical protein
MYVIIRNSDGKFVSCPGSQYSYTNYLQKAQTFSTKEIAERHACGNETVIDTKDCFKR